MSANFYTAIPWATSSVVWFDFMVDFFGYDDGLWSLPVVSLVYEMP